MNSKLCNKLRFAIEPVAIYFTNERPADAVQAQPGKRICVASMLIAAAKGKTVVFDENTYGCPGGGVGLCFGNAFEKNHHPTESLLSTGDEALKALGQTVPVSLGRGERFFASPELVGKWKASLPFPDAPEQYVVFKPLRAADEAAPPDLIFILANPDQLSALVILSGYTRGEALNVIAPFGAACHSISSAYMERGKEKPLAIMGFFDIAQRNQIPKELLSLTMTYDMFREIENGVDDGPLTTHSWELIAERFEL